MPELTAAEWEAMHVTECESRQRLFAAISRNPELLKLWVAWQQAESALVDAGRALRSSELTR
jgi:hypothetical protein